MVALLEACHDRGTVCRPKIIVGFWRRVKIGVLNTDVPFLSKILVVRMGFLKGTEDQRSKAHAL